MKREKFLVIGLGILGESVAKTLSEEGAEVIAIDSDPYFVEQIKDKVSVAVEGDATDVKTLEQVGAIDMDAAIVCIGEKFESAVLATANLLDIGVRHVAARANTKMAASILKRVGAHDVFFVERAMGKVIAHKLREPTVLTEMDLGGGYHIVQWVASDKMSGKSLSELALPKNFRIQVIGIRKNEDQRAMRPPAADTKVETKDLLLLSGYEKDLNRFFDSFKSE